MTPAFVLRTLTLATLAACATAHAVPTSLSTGQVGIDFDPDGFTFTRDLTAFGSPTAEDILPSSVSITAQGNGFVLDFNSQMSVYASSYFNFAPETLSGYFNAQFNFTPTAGHVITGYTVTYAGTYSIETPGSISLGGPGVAVSEYTGAGGFSYSGVLSGPTLPSLTGGISATGDLTTVQVYDHSEEVFDHYESVLDYCEVDDPGICHYHDEAVNISVPYYRDETDLGDATLNLQSISVQAHVAAVPEPQAYGLLMAGVPLAVWASRRRRHGTKTLA
jgi:hypothetical protein